MALKIYNNLYKYSDNTYLVAINKKNLLGEKIVINQYFEATSDSDAINYRNKVWKENNFETKTNQSKKVKKDKCVSKYIYQISKNSYRIRIKKNKLFPNGFSEYVEGELKEVEELCVKANLYLPDGMKEKINSCIGCEKSPLSKQVLGDIVRNIDCAKELEVPICQDTGMAVIFLEVGQDVHFTGGNLTEAINEGVASGYVNGKLRLSVVEDPLERKNTNNNTPAIVHTSIVPGDKVHIMVAPKGFGSENMSALKMFTPSATREDIVNFVVETVSKAGSNPCPPITVGVGIGGDFELSALLAKKALCRDLKIRNPKPLYADMESEMLEKINKLGIGPQGFGGTVTALYVNIEQHPTHIAGLPVAVNIGCHVTRHAEAEL